MAPFHVKGLGKIGKGFGVAGACFTVLAFASVPSLAEDTILTVQVMQPPVSLSPRTALDATAQKLNMLLLRGLVRIDANLNPQPDLAERWEVLDGGKLWRFWLKKDQKDHDGAPIDATAMAACLESYRRGKPTSPYSNSIPKWEKTTAGAGFVEMQLGAPNPYVTNNLNLFRYFRMEGASEPCTEPKPGQRFIGSGPLKATPWELAPEKELLLEPAFGTGNDLPAPDQPKIRMLFTMDENTRVLKLLRGDVDVAFNCLSLAKTRWVQKKYPERFRIIERDSTVVSYLAFNHRDPILKKKEVRLAIAKMIERDSIVRNKMFDLGSVAGSLVSPLLPEGKQISIETNQSEAETLLDKAGYPRGADGVRFKLKFRTTPVRDGAETAMIVQERLARIGVQVTLDVVEPAVWIKAVKSGNFQLITSRWIGVKDGSILYGTMHTGEPQNRIGLSDPELDRMLEAASTEMNLERRRDLLGKMQQKMIDDMIYLPLWYWKSALVMKKEWSGVGETDISLAGALDSVLKLRRNKTP